MRVIGGGLLIAVDGGPFFGLNVEDGVEPRDLEDVVDALGQVQEFQLAAGGADSGESADQFADAGAVDIVHVGEIQQDLLFSRGDQFLDGVAEGRASFTESDSTTEIDDRYATVVPNCSMKGHESRLLIEGGCLSSIVGGFAGQAFHHD